MPYVALEWDHRIGKPMIRWLVVQCAGVGEKCGGPVALAPRRDVAYFCNDATAERDAKAFAAYKNAQHEGRGGAPRPHEQKKGDPERHFAYAWDHSYMAPLIRWGVLEWGGKGGEEMPRTDVGYFLDPETAEADARAFSWMRDDLPKVRVSQGDPEPA